MFGSVTTDKPGYMQSLSTGDEKTATKKSARPVNVVTTDNIKTFLWEFDHKQGEIWDTQLGREEIIKRPTERVKAW